MPCNVRTLPLSPNLEPGEGVGCLRPLSAVPLSLTTSPALEGLLPSAPAARVAGSSRCFCPSHTGFSSLRPHSLCLTPSSPHSLTLGPWGGHSLLAGPAPSSLLSIRSPCGSPSLTLVSEEGRSLPCHPPQTESDPFPPC